MKKLGLLIIGILILTGVKAQQLPLYSQYLINEFLLNPAIAGNESYVPIRLTARKQWTGIKYSPSTVALSAHGKLKNQKMGLGGYLFNDSFGPLQLTGLQGAYSYQIPLYNISSTLSFGVSATMYQFSLDESKFEYVDTDDPVISLSKQTSIVPDANFGMYLSNDKYYVGIAAAQLIEWNLKVELNAPENRLQRHYYGMAGYKIAFGESSLEIEPSVLVKTTEKSPLQVDVNVKAFYDKNYWLGISYRHDDAVIAMIGVKVKTLFIGYAFDYTLSNISNYSNGSHEVVLGYNLGQGKLKGASLL